MKEQLLFTCCLFAAVAAFAETDPSVSGVTLAQKTAGSRLATVTYTLTDGPAIVTASFATNGVALPDNVATSLVGDINCIVTNTACSFTWNCEKDWPEQKITTPSMSVTLTAWPVAFPPLYCAIDVKGGTSAASYPLAFYASSNAVPGGITNDLYKTTKILLRKIDRTDSGGFPMGSPYFEAGRNATREQQHTVVLTHDYYIGVYEITQEQWRRVMGAGVSATFTAGGPSGVTYCPMRPMENVKYVEWRGAPSDGINFPSTSNKVSSASFMGVLREKTRNIFPFDLPTCAQWERAARAGTVDSYCDGSTWCTQSDTVLTNYARYKADVKTTSPAASTPPADGGTAIVGSYLPNAWGLYDVHGNVLEWCCDWLLYDANLPDAVDPVGPAADQAYRAARGGHWQNPTPELRFARCNGWDANTRYYTFGARLCATLAQ